MIQNFFLDIGESVLWSMRSVKFFKFSVNYAALILVK